MALSKIASATGTTSSALPTGTAVGDTVVVVAYRSASTTPPTVPAGWSTAGSGGTSNSLVVAFRIYDGTWTITGFTNASRIVAITFRGADPAAIGSLVVANATNATITWAALDTTIDDGSSIVIRGVVDTRVNSLPTPTSTTLIDQSGTQPAFGTFQDTDGSDPAARTSAAGRSSAFTVVSFEVIQNQGQQIAVGQASETDTAQPIGVRPQRIAVGQASEADTAQAVPHTGGANPVVLVDFNSNAQNAVTALSLTSPTGVQVGDLMIACVVVQGATAVTVGTIFAGWTELDTQLGTDGTNGVSFHVYFKIAESTSESQSFTWTGAQDAAGSIFAFRGVDPTTPILDSGGVGQASGTSIDVSGIDTADNGIALFLSSTYVGGTASTTDPPTGFIEDADVSTSGTGVMHEASHFATAAATAQTFSGTQNRSSLEPSAAEVVSIQPPVVTGHTVAVGQASEADTAQPVTAIVPHVVAAGQASEADTAQPVTGRKTRSVGQASTTDTAEPATGRKTRALGQASEADTVQPVAHSKARALGQAAATDTAQPITGGKRQTVGQASETGTAQPINAAGSHVISVGQATETDTVQPLTWAPKIRLLGQASTTATAQSVAAAKTRAVGQTSDLSSAQPIAPSKARAAGQVSESDSAGALTARKVRGVAQAAESDSAQPIVPRKVRTIGQATVAVSAQTVRAVKSRVLGQASTSAIAQALRALKRRLLGQSVETDSAGAIANAAAADAPDEDRPTFLTLSRPEAHVTLSPTDARLALTDTGAGLTLAGHADLTLVDTGAAVELVDHDATVTLADRTRKATISG